jgi:hypothetical protein
VKAEERRLAKTASKHRNSETEKRRRERKLAAKNTAAENKLIERKAK